MNYKNSRLYQTAFIAQNYGHEEQRQRLAVALDLARNQAELLSGEVARTLPMLTDHSVKHLDALWELADLLAGQDIKLNPAEAFVFGCSVLIHDIANSVAAFPRGLADLKGPAWEDLISTYYIKEYDRQPTEAERKNPTQEFFNLALITILRQAHAAQAEKLSTEGFYVEQNERERVHIIMDEGLRNDLGRLIGKIARSHHWDISDVAAHFDLPSGTSPELPAAWTIDSLKLACLLRCADIAHIDSRRAPRILQAVRKPQGVSADHWDFQARLLRPSIQNRKIVYRSNNPFPVHKRDAWWLCFDTLRWIHSELAGVEDLLQRTRGFGLSASAVEGTAYPNEMAKYISTEGWEPLDVKIHISDVIGIVEKLGGRQLYGDNPLIPLRELISNSIDAIHARRSLEKNRPPLWGRIDVRLLCTREADWLEVEDSGKGMSSELLKGPLLDFGGSYWRSDLVRKEHPGLVSSQFEPVGKFGIGFFSTFMLGSKIQVISRPFSASRDSTRVLELEVGTRNKPAIRNAIYSELARYIPDGGSVVRIQLDPKVKLKLMETSTILPAIKRAVENVAPAVDCDIYVSDGNDTILAVAANDWISMPITSLFDRLVRPFTKELRGIYGDIRSGERVVGRISFPQRYSRVGVFSVGGLSTFAQPGNFAGILLAGEPTLSRMTAKPLLSLQDLHNFLAGQSQNSLVRNNINENADIAKLYLGCGILPARVCCFQLPDGDADYEDLVDWFRDFGVGDEVLIPETTTFSVSVADDDIEVDISKSDGWLQPENVVLIGQEYKGGQLFEGFPPKPPIGLSFWTVLGTEVPCTLEIYALQAAAQAWGIDKSCLLNSCDYRKRNLGDIDIRSEFEDVELDCLILKRPETS